MVREVAVGSFHAAVCAMQALLVLGALILLIIATIGGAHEPTITAGYVGVSKMNCNAEIMCASRLTCHFSRRYGAW